MLCVLPHLQKALLITWYGDVKWGPGRIMRSSMSLRSVGQTRHLLLELLPLIVLPCHWGKSLKRYAKSLDPGSKALSNYLHFFVGSFAKCGVTYTDFFHTSIGDTSWVRIQSDTRRFKGSKSKYMDRAGVSGALETHWAALFSFQTQGVFTADPGHQNQMCPTEHRFQKRGISQVDLLLTPRTLCVSSWPHLQHRSLYFPFTADVQASLHYVFINSAS